MPSAATLCKSLRPYKKAATECADNLPQKLPCCAEIRTFVAKERDSCSFRKIIDIDKESKGKFIMKKLLFTLVAFLFATTSFALPKEPLFGFTLQKNAEDYQQYVGKIFFMRSAFGTIYSWENSGFKFKSSDEKSFFKITKIKVTEFEDAGRVNRKIVVTAYSANSGAQIKFQAYELPFSKKNSWGEVIDYPLIWTMPVVFTEPFNEFREGQIGNIIKHELVKDNYEITDLSFDDIYVDGHRSNELIATAKNTRTGETNDYQFSKVEQEVFNEALKGRYTSSLIMVEKPEDLTDRYSETKTITDQGVEKYSYNDSIINITIFATEEDFVFTLKNISNHSIKIIWNEAAYAGLDGSSLRIMHVGTKYADRYADQPVTTVMKGTKIEECITPAANVYHTDGEFGGWKAIPLFPKHFIGNEAGEVRLMLPIQIKNVVNEYTFVFKANYTFDHPELLNMDLVKEKYGISE